MNTEYVLNFLNTTIEAAKNMKISLELGNLGQIQAGDKIIDLSADREIEIINTWIDYTVNQRDRLMGLKR